MIDENDVSVELKTGDIALVPENLVYTQVAKDENLFVIHFTCNEKLPMEIKKITPHRTEYFEKLFESIYNAWRNKHIGYMYECKSILYKILFNIECEQYDSALNSSTNKMLEVADYINNNITDHTLSVEQLARFCGMSTTLFRKKFQETFSLSPLKYIQQVRVDYARELLQSKYYTIEEVSEKCGFNNTNYFSFFIKKHTGFSPSAYRNKITQMVDTDKRTK